MEKLLSHGKSLIENPSERSDENPPSPGPARNFSSHDLMHFSSHDLIRENIADPPTFDEMVEERNDDGVVIMSPENAPIRAESAVSSWGFSLNPFAYLQRQEDAEGSTAAPNAGPADAEAEPANVASPGGFEDSGPQLTSTRNDEDDVEK